MFIREITERLAGIFSDGVPNDFDWSDEPVGEDEEVIGEATDDLLRLHELRLVLSNEVRANCLTNKQAIEAIMDMDKEPDEDRMIEVIRLGWEHKNNHEHAELLNDLFWEEIKLACPKSHVFRMTGIRQGRKIIGSGRIRPTNIARITTIKISHLG